MTALVIIVGILAYLLAATAVARRLAWNFYQGRIKAGEARRHSDKYLRDESTFSACLLSFLLLPVALWLVASNSVADNGFMLPPKNIRAMQRAERAEEYSRELERKLGINR